jgi:hypothetical protein
VYTNLCINVKKKRKLTASARKPAPARRTRAVRDVIKLCGSVKGSIDLLLDDSFGKLSSLIPLLTDVSLV